ncbi:MAG: YggS family pyridoxal phosphate-dependent enzyme [Verrucomicrobiales bacterium]|nr:YggS family pyridoxal phosphate-dependent enzyme [Verrucomicrobiales bacterium]
MSIQENLEAVHSRIADAEKVSGREPGSATLVAVSKTWPVEVIQEAVAAGQKVFGENKVQEILAKVPAMVDDLEWHLIGHLQKNKTRKILPLCASIHSLDSIELAQQMNRIAGELEMKAKVLVQVNVSGDEAKFGFSPEAAREHWESLLGLEHLKIGGLMTVPAFNPDPEVVRPDFARLRELRDALVVEFGATLPELSMGMSHDFAVAIEEGASLVRVGSSIFGKRDYGTT